MNAKQLFFLLLILFSSLNLKAQSFYGNTAINLGENVLNTSLNSGAYFVAINQAGHPNTGNSKYLLNIKRNTTTNEQFQITTGSWQDDKLYFRTVRAALNETANSPWYEVATRGKNTFIGDQKINGTLYANKVTVQATTWADFVFEDDYELPSLDEVANHIKENKHLPGIPSAKEVEENGISLGDMNAKLLQKIEEMTLYMIQQQDAIVKLTTEVEELKSQK